jgi:hypothetical protein
VFELYGAIQLVSGVIDALRALLPREITLEDEVCYFSPGEALHFLLIAVIFLVLFGRNLLTDSDLGVLGPTLVLAQPREGDVIERGLPTVILSHFAEFGQVFVFDLFGGKVAHVNGANLVGGLRGDYWFVVLPDDGSLGLLLKEVELSGEAHSGFGVRFAVDKDHASSDALLVGVHLLKGKFAKLDLKGAILATICVFDGDLVAPDVEDFNLSESPLLVRTQKKELMLLDLALYDCATQHRTIPALLSIECGVNVKFGVEVNISTQRVINRK